MEATDGEGDTTVATVMELNKSKFSGAASYNSSELINSFPPFIPRFLYFSLPLSLYLSIQYYRRLLLFYYFFFSSFSSPCYIFLFSFFLLFLFTLFFLAHFFLLFSLFPVFCLFIKTFYLVPLILSLPLFSLYIYFSPPFLSFLS